MGKELRMISIKEATVMGHIHVCEANAAPCDDLEDQSVLTIGREGLLFTGGS